ncbi:MAG: helix-turn-helix domain-containing protein [Lachnospiraceae bacterium]|nr:helix-turn-helix domain-containing protein [Lachnospiraceae bacterium]
MEIGNKIKMLRLKKGATQEMMAQELCVSSQAVSKWENSVCAPDIAMLPKLSVYFGVTIDELFDMTAEQRLHRIEHMLDMEETLSEAEFKETVSFLEEEIEKAMQNAGRDESYLAQLNSLLAHTYHHRMASDGRKVSEYARKSMRLAPDVKSAQWLLEDSEGAVCHDWNISNHSKTIRFYQELIENNPTASRNYVELMDNLLDDFRVDEAEDVLKKYAALENKKELWVWVFEAKIAIARFDPVLAFQKIHEMETLFPDDPNVLFQIGNFYARLRRYDEAISYYDKSWEKDPVPRYCDALESEAAIYELQGNYEQALTCWDRIRENLEQEWKVYEGASVQRIWNEKNRILKLMR